jgi:hypothetical protein
MCEGKPERVNSRLVLRTEVLAGVTRGYGVGENALLVERLGSRRGSSIGMYSGIGIAAQGLISCSERTFGAYGTPLADL